MSIQNRGVYSAHRNLRAVNFFCQSPEATAVSLVGDFNGWNASANPMTRAPDGTWALRLELRHGHHRYAFLVDGNLTLDPKAMGVSRDDQNRRVSLIAVS
ncbi:MAG: glycoside hydrolase family 13 [Verrucomicrobia bacterium]|nr:MAG: glycoside hydrolase family 13 [Verrucomicrobiota bacterium]